ncbi:hypothetical protein PP7435_CHR4-2126 [Komagataella phaffii CBS 7435]|uniref:Uncharacterized protein n=1 Tax=Komagataella phaffii (strain ATCC 76273 / CBS 7435 / CECT 11047 / NRRL Y-11430 / Wegner 21-1) TaxID=981350 RepID=A0A1G4KR11_KOMPC|nr:hypothetical protein BQ9382_C4-5282 [Komagataella phaffii CBS 7435]SCV12440.1 hypothetical protein PP7435_CHR4-2126 [Komagataella phaffii CBS 7435]
MPDPEAKFKDFSIPLKVDHALIIFCPSVTQILNAVQTVHHDRSIKLAFSRCIEEDSKTLFSAQSVKSLAIIVIEEVAPTLR